MRYFQTSDSLLRMLSFHPVTPLANAKLAPDINAAPQISNSQTTVLEHYETPQQKYLSGQGLSLIAIRTNCLKMAKKLECSRQRLALLDATILNKLSSKNNSVCASKLRLLCLFCWALFHRESLGRHRTSCSPLNGQSTVDSVGATIGLTT